MTPIDSRAIAKAIVKRAWMRAVLDETENCTFDGCVLHAVSDEETTKEIADETMKEMVKP